MPEDRMQIQFYASFVRIGEAFGSAAAACQKLALSMEEAARAFSHFRRAAWIAHYREVRAWAIRRMVLTGARPSRRMPLRWASKRAARLWRRWSTIQL